MAKAKITRAGRPKQANSKLRAEIAALKRTAFQAQEMAKEAASTPRTNSEPIKVTIIDADRLRAITALASATETLARALQAAPTTTISGCVITGATGPGISISTERDR